MRLALQNIRTMSTGEGTRLVAELVALDYGFSIETSVWAELLGQYRQPASVDPDHLTKKALVKEAILVAEAKLAEKQVASAQNLAATMAKLTANPAPAPLAVDATEEETEVYEQVLAAHQQAQTASNGAQAYSDALAAFEVEYKIAKPLRVDAFYSALKAHYEVAGDAERVTHVQEEWDAWTASQVDASGLEGEV